MTFNWGLLGASYALMHATHGIADYWLQTDWQAQNKSKNWGALSDHVTTYAIAFMPIGIFLNYCASIGLLKCLLLPFVVALPHAWMDRRTFIGQFVSRTKGWEWPIQWDKHPPIVCAVRNHVLIAMDQKFHYLCLALTALWLSWGVP